MFPEGRDCFPVQKRSPGVHPQGAEIVGGQAGLCGADGTGARILGVDSSLRHGR